MSIAQQKAPRHFAVCQPHEKDGKKLLKQMGKSHRTEDSARAHKQELEAGGAKGLCLYRFTYGQLPHKIEGPTA